MAPTESVNFVLVAGLELLFALRKGAASLTGCEFTQNIFLALKHSATYFQKPKKSFSSMIQFEEPKSKSQPERNLVSSQH